jgi:capsular polysaccharide biosynthesis protein
MSEQALDLRRSIQIVRRHRLLMGIMVALGILAGGAYAVLSPPLVTSTALVVLSESGQAAQAGAAAAANGVPDPYTATQEVIAKSNPVLSAALPHVRPAMSVNELRRAVAVDSPTSFIISISVQEKAASDAAETANAVAESYISYISSASSPGGQVPAQLLESATSPAGAALPKQLAIYAIYALVGAIFGALIGALVALAISRGDRRLRERDEIANSIGVPVLASFPVGHPSSPGEWTRFLEDYKPGAMPSLQLRKALQQVEMAAAEVNYGSENGTWSFTVLSLAADQGAVALGPQLAIFAAAQGTPTALVIGPQQDATVTATLRTACAAPHASSKWPGNLRVVVADGDAEVPQDVTLAVVVSVVDARNPQVPGTMRTTATLLGVSAGAATADQLARMAVSAVSDGREITGILVADPDSADPTTGRLPQLGRWGQRRMPTRMTGLATESKR